MIRSLAIAVIAAHIGLTFVCPAFASAASQDHMDMHGLTVSAVHHAPDCCIGHTVPDQRNEALPTAPSLQAACAPIDEQSSFSATEYRIPNGSCCDPPDTTFVERCLAQRE